MTKSASSSAILAIAVPAMLTNVATALFGVADMWAIGRLGDPAAQGAVEVGARFFLTLLIVFNFLRTSTVALTAQAAGHDDKTLQARILMRTIAISLAIGIVLMAAAPLAIPYGLSLFNVPADVLAPARDYADIRYWSALPWLLNAALTGWLVGRKYMRTLLFVEIAINLLHVGLDLVTVLWLGWGVTGVATASLASETARVLVLGGFVVAQLPLREVTATIVARATWDMRAITAVMKLNRDLFIRTLLLMAASVAMTRAGASQGTLILATNAILGELFMLSTWILDGFESAAQVLCAEALGAGDKSLFRRLIIRIMAWACGVAVLISAAYWIEARPLASAFSTADDVVASVESYIGWAAVMPVVGVISFVFDGIFIGAGWTRGMLQSMAVSLAGFFVLLMVTQNLGNDGLWLSYAIFFLLRGLVQFLLMPGLLNRNFRSMMTPADA